jgi:peptidyl-prolyl cis-trans isomerase SurA
LSRRPAAVLVAVVLVALAPRAGAEEELVDGIVAQVGTDVVLLSEVTRVTAPMEERLRAAGGSEADVNMVRADLLERLIERRLVEQVVRRMELQASDAEVDQAVAGIAAENNLTLDQLRESLESHDVEWEAYREKIRGEIQRSKILNGMVRSKVKVDESEVRALYQERFAGQRSGGQEVHLRHLVVAGGDAEEMPRSHDEACDAVRGARARMQGGESFDALARELSDSNARNGGDVGWVHVDDLAPWMGDAIEGLGKGEISPVIEMPFGCNLFQVVERRSFEAMTYEQAQPQLYAELFNQRLEEEYANWIDEIRQRTYIDRKGMFAQAARLGDDEPRDPTKLRGQRGLQTLEE